MALVTEEPRRISLPDGRMLAYDEYGPSGGLPVVVCHGWPTSRLDWLLAGGEGVAERARARVIVPDRPGIGRSELQPGRRVLDWPADVAALADALGLGRFALLSISAGGPYALACALRLAERLTALALVSSPAPFDAPEVTVGMNPDNLRFFRLVRQRPWLGRLSLWLGGVMMRLAPERAVAQVLASVPPPDRAVAARPGVAEVFLATAREGMRQPRGSQVDGALIAGPWGFDLADIRVPVQLWHGEADRNAPIAMGHYLAERIPRAQSHFLPGEGHFSVLADRAEQILSDLVDAKG